MERGASKAKAADKSETGSGSSSEVATAAPPGPCRPSSRTSASARGRGGRIPVNLRVRGAENVPDRMRVYRGDRGCGSSGCLESEGVEG